MILFLDSSDTLLKIGLVNGEKIDFIYKESPLNEFNHFYSLLDNLLIRNKIPCSAIDKIIVNRGPGSFMGTRMAIMIAKTLSYLNRSKLIAVDSFSLVETVLKTTKPNGANRNKIFAFIKPLLKNNFIFTLIQGNKRLIPISKLEISTQNFYKSISEFTIIKKRMIGKTKEWIIDEKLKNKWNDLEIDQIVFLDFKTKEIEKIKNNLKNTDEYLWYDSKKIIETFLSQLTQHKSQEFINPLELVPLYI